ncbi:hypothetical protein PG991_006122 [Apiospora marii]|uniref:Uncharacterized protein n=1 Tax=Apiospora marii TaxID=335849 RepID=A0ABR1SB34_9PEZI
MGACLLPEEQTWLHAVTEKFGTEITRDGLACWTASDLVEFLALTLPEPLKTDLYMASLLLQRCLLRLGSYPYLNRPAPGLTFETLSVAVAILLQRYDESANPVGVTGLIYELFETQGRSLAVLLFQSLRTSSTTESSSSGGASRSSHRSSHSRRTSASAASSSSSSAYAGQPRTAVDDEHLLQAHQLLLNCNHRYSDADPTVLEFGPALVPAHELPSPRAADVAGHIVHRDQFRSLLKLLLYCEAPPYGLDADGVAPNADWRELEAAAQGVLARFLGGGDGGAWGVGWGAFEMGFLFMAPRLMTGLGNLLSTFVLCPVGMDQMGRLSRDRMIAVIQQAMSAPIDPMYNAY